MDNTGLTVSKLVRAKELLEAKDVPIDAKQMWADIGEILVSPPEEMIEFPNVGIVKIPFQPFAYGSNRVAFKCDYKDEQGREYIVKQAICDTGYMNNLVEHLLYRMGTPEFKNECAIFLDVTECGQYLLVEKCTPALHRSDTWHGINLEFQHSMSPFQHIPMYDMHAMNWGYTLLDNRPVVFDLAYDEGQSVSVAVAAGVMPEHVWDIAARFDAETEGSSYSDYSEDYSVEEDEDEEEKAA